jgi:hypothetical protein
MRAKTRTTAIATALRLLAATAASALAATGCTSTDSFNKVDLKLENDPPLSTMVMVSGSSITIPEGIGIAVTVTPYANGSVDDSLPVEVTGGTGSGLAIEPGAAGDNELFITGLAPGSYTMTLGLPPSTQDKAGNNIDGVVSVPVTVTAQM